jgi:hypothetical protein
MLKMNALFHGKSRPESSRRQLVISPENPSQISRRQMETSSAISGVAGHATFAAFEDAIVDSDDQQKPEIQ